jgi:hypothetical protein
MMTIFAWAVIDRYWKLHSGGRLTIMIEKLFCTMRKNGAMPQAKALLRIPYFMTFKTARSKTLVVLDKVENCIVLIEVVGCALRTMVRMTHPTFGTANSL